MMNLSRRSWFRTAGTAVLGASVAVPLLAQQRRRRGRRAPLELKVREGDPVPDVELTAVWIENGKPVQKKVRLSDFKGKKNVVLYFFPKASTPG